MPIRAPEGYLDITNATLRASEIVTTSNVGIANANPTNTLSIGSNVFFEDTSSNAMTVRGNVVAEGIKLGFLQLLPSYDLELTANVGNSISNTVQFTNSTTGFVTSSNVGIGTNAPDGLVDVGTVLKVKFGNLGATAADIIDGYNTVDITESGGTYTYTRDTAANYGNFLPSTALYSPITGRRYRVRLTARSDFTGSIRLENPANGAIVASYDLTTTFTEYEWEFTSIATTMYFRATLTTGTTMQFNAFSMEVLEATANTDIMMGGTRFIKAHDASKNFVAIGPSAGQTSQGSYATAVGNGAGDASQGVFTIAVGSGAGRYNQGDRGVAVGAAAGNTSQSNDAVAVGYLAGQTSQGAYATAVGQQAGQTDQGSRATALGVNAGRTSQGVSAVAVGDGAAITDQGTYAVAVGYVAGSNNQGGSATAVGNQSGRTSQGTNAVAVGVLAGNNTQGTNTVAVGNSAGQTEQANNAIAIGSGAGQTSQGLSAVTVGLNSGRYNQGTKSVAIGVDSGVTSQGNGAIAVGDGAGNNTQGAKTVAVGYNAGKTDQATSATAVGDGSGYSNQGTLATAVGVIAGQFNQGDSAVAVGAYAGLTSQGSYATALGYQAGQASQGVSAVAVGRLAGQVTQGLDTVAVGVSAGQTNQTPGATALGPYTAQYNQGGFATAVGNAAGRTSQGISAVAAGYDAGRYNQGNYATAVGNVAGQTAQGENAVAVGNYAGYSNQGTSATAVGYLAGGTSQGNEAVAVGRQAGQTNQGTNATAVGVFAGLTSQGNEAVAVGRFAGAYNQHNNSIVLNATGSALNTAQASSFYVKPVRGGNIAASALAYTSAGEIVEETNVHFDTNGNVGIGTASPDYKLHVHGNSAGINLGPLAAIGFVDGGVSFCGIKVGQKVNSPYSRTALSVEDDGNSILHVDGWNRRVGIGVTNPVAALDFGSSVRNRIINLWGSDTGGDSSTNFYGFGVNSGTLRYNVDFSTSVHKFYGGSTEFGYVNNATGFVNSFTGQHKSFPHESLFGKTSDDLCGLIVSASGEYISINDKVPQKGQGAIQVSEAIPTVKLSTSEKDKKVFGVISDVEDVETSQRHDHYGAFVSTFEKEQGDSRIYVNSIGEGAMWVVNTAGPLESGDYITTSNVAGYGQKQDSDSLKNYTVAKITMDCDFAPATQPIQQIIKELVNVNYWVKTTYSNVSVEEYSNLAVDMRTSTTETYYSNEDGVISVTEYSNLESNVQSTYTELTRTVYQKISKKEFKTEIQGYDIEVREELVNVLDEHGQLQWENDPSGATEKAYKIRYLDVSGAITDEANAVHIAAFVGVTYHCG
jgi:hypothetical protein